MQIEAGGIGVAGQQTPFWLRANQYGTVPLAGSTATLRVGLTSDYRSVTSGDSPAKRHKIDWGYGVNVVGNAGQQTQLLLSEAYVKGRLGQFEVYAGRKRDIIGLVDTVLTSGSYSWSGNALPIPKLQLGTRGYVELPFTKNFVAFNSLFNYGWFENQDKKVLDTKLHQFAFYLRLGKPNGKVKLYGGINHQVVWGGYSHFLANNVSHNGQLPNSSKAYFYVVTGLPYPTTAVDTNVSSIDEGNRIGNHLGSLDIGLEVALPMGRLLLYRQNPYDTGALYYLTTIADGLNGISFRRSRSGLGLVTVDQVLVEWLYTESQGGPLFIIGNPYTQGRVNYFSNSQYIDGWQYYGRTIGTPFLTPQREVRSTLPVSYVIANNRVSVWHVGLSGRVRERVEWMAKLSYSQNLGTYDRPYPLPGVNQFSGLIAVSVPLALPLAGTVQLKTSLAVDAGQLLPASSGGYLSIKRMLTTSRATRRSLPKPALQPMLRLP